VGALSLFQLPVGLVRLAAWRRGIPSPPPPPRPVTSDSRACGDGYSHCARPARGVAGGGSSVTLRRFPGTYVSTAGASLMVPVAVSLLGEEKGSGRWFCC